MSPNTWGPPVWTLFHTLAEKINEESYPLIGNQIFYMIYKICSCLPCPDCSGHATKFLGKINMAALKTKTDLKNILYVFHNVVNVRKGKPTFPTALLNGYEKRNLGKVYNNFISVYNTRGNMQLLAESFQRQRVIKEFKGWITNNISHFTPVRVLPEPKPQQIQAAELQLDSEKNKLTEIAQPLDDVNNEKIE